MFDHSVHQLFDYMIHESSTLCLLIDKEGVILQSNSFADKLSGQKLTGLPITDLFLHFNRAPEISEYLSPPGEKILVNVITKAELPSTYYFIFYDLGSSVLAIGEADNLDSDKLRKNLLELNQDLHNLSRELQKKTIELTKLNELKNQFLGIAAHDLRNPLNIIMGFNDFLNQDLENQLCDRHTMMFAEIQKSSRFMLQLIDNLLDVSTIESGKLTVNREQTDIAMLIKRNVELNNFVANKKSINIHFDKPDFFPAIPVDCMKIEQVLNNLLSNAVKFSHPGTSIQVKLHAKNNFAIVSVADNGQGIPETDLKKLFTPFGTTNVKSTAGEKSTGLGLSIVQNIIHGHQGEIWVESKVDQGTVFFFSLPLTE